MKQSSFVLIRPFVKCPWQEDIVGILRRHLFDANGQLSASVIYVKRRFSRDEQEQLKVWSEKILKNYFKNTLFDIKLARASIERELLDWLRRNNEWIQMPGYNTMLYSFKCKPWPASDQIGPDPTDWIGKDEKVMGF